jgi:hypothetical protein
MQCACHQALYSVLALASLNAIKRSQVSGVLSACHGQRQGRFVRRGGAASDGERGRAGVRQLWCAGSGPIVVEVLSLDNVVVRTGRRRCVLREAVAASRVGREVVVVEERIELGGGRGVAAVAARLGRIRARPGRAAGGRVCGRDEAVKVVAHRTSMRRKDENLDERGRCRARRRLIRPASAQLRSAPLSFLCFPPHRHALAVASGR